MKEKYFNLQVLMKILVIFLLVLSFLPINFVQADNRFVLWDKQYTTDSFKTWTITFNLDVDFTTITPGTVYIEDEVGDRFDSYVYQGENKKKVLLSPSRAYEPYKTYYLIVDNKVRSADNKSIHAPYKIPFAHELAGEGGSIINFPDKNLEAAVRQIIKQPEGEIHKSEIYNIKSLDLSNLSIENLDGIEHFAKLESLNLSNNKVKKSLALRHHSYFLKELDLSSNQLQDIDFVYDLNNLEILNLANNEIEDLSPLKFTSNLTSLNLANNRIKNISVLASKTNLTKLFLKGNFILDFRHVKPYYGDLVEKDFDLPALKGPIKISGLEMGQAVDGLIRQLGQPDRIDLSGMDYSWYIYNQDYGNYIQVGIHEDRIVSIYSAQDSLLADYNIDLGMTKSQVESILSQEPTYEDGYMEGHRYILDDTVLTFYYDIYKNEELIAVWAEDLNFEPTIPKFTDSLLRDIEKQIFDLTNVARIQNNRPAYLWNEPAALTARKHSEDMALYNYTSHYDSQGRGPWQRAQDDNLDIRNLSENVASGHLSAIEVHHAWMDSEGHKDNILTFLKELGVGAARSSHSDFYGHRPYYTQLFITPTHYDFEDEEFYP